MKRFVDRYELDRLSSDINMLRCFLRSRISLDSGVYNCYRISTIFHDSKSKSLRLIPCKNVSLFFERTS